MSAKVPRICRERLARRLTAGVLVCISLSGCSAFRPWHNPDPQRPSPAHLVEPGPDRSMMVAVTLSGGGSRAAAFGLGVLKALKAARLNWDGRETTLLDEVSFISGVSGGSILAAHYAAFGDDTLQRFERDFLDVNLERQLWGAMLLPGQLYRLTSPWYGRSHMLSEALDPLYAGKTLGDAADRPGAPELLISATDMRMGSTFEFTSEQLSPMCIDWRRVPLSFAVAASAAVPLLLTPLPLRNHAGQCDAKFVADSPQSTDFRTELRTATAASYRDSTARPNVHLIDGGVADNLGVRGLLDRFVADGSIRQAYRQAHPGTIRRLVLVVVNAERHVDDDVEASDRVPSMGQVLHTLVYGAGSRETQVTLAMLRQDLHRWSQELLALRGQPQSPFAADAEMHVIVVNLQDVVTTPAFRGLARLPTSLALASIESRQLQHAAREALCRQPAYQALLGSVGAHSESCLSSAAPELTGTVP